jgi:hypothetical protein
MLLTILLLCCGQLASCGRAGAGELAGAALPGSNPTAPATGGPLAGLPPLPLDDGPNGNPLRGARAVIGFAGVDRLYDSGSGVSVNPNNGIWLELDARTAANYAWAVWRLPVPPTDPFELIQVNCATPAQRYYMAYGDYSRGRWVFYQLTQSPQGFAGTFNFDPALLPGGVAALTSPGGFVYLALIAAPANTDKLQVKGLDYTIPDEGGGGGGDPPIFDQFEDNDTLDTATLLEPGIYRASIHQSPVIELMSIGELRDYYDCYRVLVPAGKILTATLRHATFDHFGSGIENDCDLLFYFPGASQILNDFDEGLSSVGIWYDPFEQVNFSGGNGSEYFLTVLGDMGEPGAKTNAEYDLGIFLSDVVYSVSGSITQNSGSLDRDVVVFLEPGNFNANTPVPGNGTPGQFSIQGVPPGTYTLKVHGSARFGPTGYEWPDVLENVVVAGNLSGLSLDIGPNP